VKGRELEKQPGIVLDSLDAPCLPEPRFVHFPHGVKLEASTVITLQGDSMQLFLFHGPCCSGGIVVPSDARPSLRILNRFFHVLFLHAAFLEQAPLPNLVLLRVLLEC